MAIDNMANYDFGEHRIGDAHGEVELSPIKHQHHSSYNAIEDVDAEDSLRNRMVEAEII